jgi:hypothetical protein
LSATIATTGRLNVDSLAKPALATVEPGTLGEAELKFVCAKAGDREGAGAFPVAVDARTFADALIVAGDEAPRAVYDRLAADPARRSSARPRPGRKPSAAARRRRRGNRWFRHATTPRGPSAPNAADYPRDSSGDAYDVTFEGLEAGELKFEVRGYSADDLIHPAMGQTERFPATSRRSTSETWPSISTPSPTRRSPIGSGSSRKPPPSSG